MKKIKLIRSLVVVGMVTKQHGTRNVYTTFLKNNHHVVTIDPYTQVIGTGSIIDCPRQAPRLLSIIFKSCPWIDSKTTENLSGIQCRGKKKYSDSR